MSTKRIVVSDLSGELAAATARWGLAGDWFEIDLTDGEFEQLRAQMSGDVAQSRWASNAIGAAGGRVVPFTTAAERRAIRAWARSRGLDLAEPGHIPLGIYRAYRKAQEDVGE